MSDPQEDGYILASALAMLFAMSLVAVALVSVSADGLHRVKTSEQTAVDQAALQSAILAAGSQLALDPRRRKLPFADGSAIITTGGRKVRVDVGWSASKLDVNRASPNEIGATFAAAGARADLQASATAAVAAAQARGTRLEALSDLAIRSADQDCLSSVLTTRDSAGTANAQRNTGSAAVEIGQPSPGSRLTIQARLEGHRQRGLAAIIMMTGDPASPFRIADWSRFVAPAKEVCRER